MTDIERPSAVRPAAANSDATSPAIRERAESRGADRSRGAGRTASPARRRDGTKKREGEGRSASGPRSAGIRDETGNGGESSIAAPAADDQKRDRADGGPRSRDHQEDRVV